MQKEIQSIKLTQYSHGAGCGCKLSPKILQAILHTQTPLSSFPSLLVGNETSDDAAVLDIGNNTAIISTTDFFMPIVDDPYDFGRIASANAISDIYAMGGKPLMAIAILGWPVDKIDPIFAAQVLDGSRTICQEVHIPLAGGHSIDNPEPLFGLAVTGIIQKNHIKKNSTAQPGDKLFLTKPLGVGILTTAQKKDSLHPDHQFVARDSMVRLNTLGEKLAQYNYVTAMTDVTGFGLLGHLVELCEGSHCSAQLYWSKIPIFSEALLYINQAIPGGTKRNWDSYGSKIGHLTDEQRSILCDPQTSGGLLVAVNPQYENEFMDVVSAQGYTLQSIGELIASTQVVVEIIN